MAHKTVSAVAKKMAAIDIAMLSTHTKGGNIASRPMSNNGDVEWDGDSHYFTWEKALLVDDIEANPKVSLAFQGDEGFYVAVEGDAEVVRDKKVFAEHWIKDLDQWFEDGPDTKGVVMIKVHATRATYWDGEEEGDIKLK